jgi:hypothetical protein
MTGKASEPWSNAQDSMTGTCNRTCLWFLGRVLVLMPLPALDQLSVDLPEAGSGSSSMLIGRGGARSVV